MFVKFDTAMPYLVTIAQLRIPLRPMVENIVISLNGAAVSEISDAAVFNFKW